jgi:hypothetical protein
MLRDAGLITSKYNEQDSRGLSLQEAPDPKAPRQRRPDDLPGRGAGHITTGARRRAGNGGHEGVTTAAGR